MPSWIAPAPRLVGTKECGKLSADQWRTTCTIHMVISLVRLWGSSPKTDRFHQLLKNYMNLVLATKLASMRVVTEDRIRLFETVWINYLKGLQTLFPQIDLAPYQHLTMHFGDYLRRFGPVHAWSCWAFERGNYLLQQIKTNMRFGMPVLVRILRCQR